MKKFITFIISLMMIVSAINADFKIMGGLNLSKYNVSPEEDSMTWSYKRGFLAGIGFEKNFIQNIVLEFDFLYFKKGSKVESADLPGFKLKYSLAAISIPVLLRFKFLDGTSPYVLGGVEFSSILSHEIKFEGEDEIDLKENTKSINFGLVFGCGYEIEIQDHLFFFIEARYHLGRTNLINNHVEEESMTPHAILIVVGMKS